MAAHVPDDRPAAVEDAGEIDRQHAVPRLGRILPGRNGRAVHAGIVDQDVDLTESFGGGLEGALNRFQISHVDGLAERRLELRFGRRQGGGIAVPGHDAAAFAGEALGDAEADAARRSRDDRRLSIQSCGHVVSRGYGSGQRETDRREVGELGDQGLAGRIGVGRLSDPVSGRCRPAGRPTRAQVGEDLGGDLEGWRR